MPRLQRSQLPRRLFRHLRDRVLERQIPVRELVAFAAWMDSDPVVPEGRWFKRFNHFVVCGEGTLVKTFLVPGQVPGGEEIGRGEVELGRARCPAGAAYRSIVHARARGSFPGVFLCPDSLALARRPHLNCLRNLGKGMRARE